MPVQKVVGAQWGDEGKGKIVDALTASGMYDAFVRDGGGPNAGHTVYIDGQKMVLHQLPVSVASSFTKNYVGPYVVVDPEVLVEELKIADAKTRTEVWLDGRAVLILPIHKALDKGRERSAGASAIGTTGRGIGPAYEDLASRRGVRLKHLTSPDAISCALKTSGYYDERCALAAFHGEEAMSFDETVEWCLRFRDAVIPRLCDVVQAVQGLAAENRRILIEGAQGVMLDIIHGTHPHVTSSFSVPGVVNATLGLQRLDFVTGITKAYATRVGAGIFPTELHAEAADELREKGGEYGATTGRPRRCGWLDLPALAYACRFGITELIMTKLDVFNTFDQIRVCTGYRLSGVDVEFSPDIAELFAANNIVPEYITLDGWKCDLRNCYSIARLPRHARTLIELVEKCTGVPVVGVSTGKDRMNMLWREEYRRSHL